MIKLIVCGSAVSWMLEKVIYAKGSLHNRITARIHLQPFSLKEVRDYLGYRGIRLNDMQVLELYMVMGGIPHYLRSVSKGLSAAQNINNICFQPEGLLLDRADGIINICEIKHYNKKFAIDKSYALRLKNRVETFREQTGTPKQLFITMITSHGLVQNEYSRQLVYREITLKDLFL